MANIKQRLSAPFGSKMLMIGTAVLTVGVLGFVGWRVVEWAEDEFDGDGGGNGPVPVSVVGGGPDAASESNSSESNSSEAPRPDSQRPATSDVEPDIARDPSPDGTAATGTTSTGDADFKLPIPELLEATDNDGVSSYDISLATSSHDFGFGQQADTVAYNGASVLGPTMRWTTGEQVDISVTNEIEAVTTAHWHGADVPAQADGGPHSIIEPGETWNASFEVIQPAATLWYHPHLMGTTAEQVASGAAGMIIIDDDNPATASLPNTYGVDDLPVILQDRELDDSGQIVFELDDGDNGDIDNPHLTVNGSIDPYVDVPAGLVRLRLLNASQARPYELSASSGEVTKIASDGGYLVAPIQVDSLFVAPGDRVEIVVDTSDGPVDLMDDTFGRVLELRPDPSLPADGVLPERLAEIDTISADEIDNQRTFVFDEFQDEWLINGKSMDMNRVDETIKLNDTERWTLTVEEGVHAFHVHQTQFQILEINGDPPPPEEAGWEDTVWITEDREVVIAARFNTYSNPDIPYMFHCHVLDHEDLGMMGQFRVVEE